VVPSKGGEGIARISSLLLEFPEELKVFFEGYFCPQDLHFSVIEAAATKWRQIIRRHYGDGQFGLPSGPHLRPDDGPAPILTFGDDDDA